MLNGINTCIRFIKSSCARKLHDFPILLWHVNYFKGFFFRFFCELFQIFSFPDLFSISFKILEFMLVHAFLRHIFIKVIIMCTETAEFSDMWTISIVFAFLFVNPIIFFHFFSVSSTILESIYFRRMSVLTCITSSTMYIRYEYFRYVTAF